MWYSYPIKPALREDKIWATIAIVENNSLDQESEAGWVIVV